MNMVQKREQIRIKQSVSFFVYRFGDSILFGTNWQEKLNFTDSDSYCIIGKYIHSYIQEEWEAGYGRRQAVRIRWS
ncbi:hypothetical protein CLOSTHATH_05969 [Hungatella hathewayi DSM 13479]|uniref:Uncharacterized protein n=1 Tax=Hungatella hathewayi DSM 13479 TaxID=566550 RepID=D3AQR3_9FIRM|nr:hypothetical protein CLOSTHATH_05969 [Hungatella hathewayi DSM 13479]